MKIDKIFRLMQFKKVHMVFVVDEFGGVSGLITMENLVEEIVGEIYDETDIQKTKIKKLNDKAFLVNGMATIEEINDALKLNFEVTEDYLTIAGYILERLGRMPKVEEKLSWGAAKIIVEKITDRRILTVRIVKK